MRRTCVWARIGIRGAASSWADDVTTTVGRLAVRVALGAILAGCVSQGSVLTPTSAATEALIEEAVVYALPVYEIARIRSRALGDSANPRRASVNRFTHVRTLADHTRRSVTAPNNDTLYSSAWLDLSAEPLVLAVPDTGGRYYSLQFMDVFSNTFAMVGRRTTGTARREFLVTGPLWRGTTPSGMTVICAPTQAVWLLGRTLVVGAEDLPAVHRLQDGMTLTPLSAWTEAPPPKRTTLEAPIEIVPGDAENFVAVVNQVLSENPLPERDQATLARIAAVGIGPRAAPLSVVLAANWRSTLPKVLSALRTERQEPGRAQAGWTYPKDDLGNFGIDYRYRALVALSGLAALEPAEAMYMWARVDGDGAPLQGAASYRLRLPAGGLPVDAFWSLTLYERTPEGQYFLVDNPLQRYSIGDRSPGLRRNADGSIDLYVQHATPEPEREANWLPAPRGPFALSMRAYQPRGELVSGRFRLPAVERTK